jgi:hypothetical protein
MRYDQRPVHRKLIVPWYDSNSACIIILATMVGVIIFAIIGISVAAESPEYQRHVWVPIILLAFSLTVLATTARRLIKRLRYRYSKDIFL